jgi:hypothetical protein
VSEIQRQQQPIQGVYMRLFDGGNAANVLDIDFLAEGASVFARDCARQPTATEVMQTPRTRSLYLPNLERPVSTHRTRTQRIT